MAKKDTPLKVEIPRPGSSEPPWSRVGIVGAAGFVVGIVWPKLAGIEIAPGVPEDLRPQTEVTAPASPAVPASAAPAPAASAAPLAAAAPSNQQLVVVGPGKISRCVNKKNRKVEDCGALQFDPIALPRLKQLSKCPSALGLSGKFPIGFDIDFGKKEVHVIKGKKLDLPSSTVNGVLQCAAREFANISLEDVPHKYRRYTLFYTATFYPPGKHPEDIADAGTNPQDDSDGEETAGTTTSETEASGTATVSWDTALVRKEPKDGEVVARLLQGTKVKLLGRQNDWYKVEAGKKSGWVYRGAIGL